MVLAFINQHNTFEQNLAWIIMLVIAIPFAYSALRSRPSRSRIERGQSDYEHVVLDTPWYRGLTEPPYDQERDTGAV